MKQFTEKISDLLESANLIITNTMQNEEILAAVGVFGYSIEKLQQGKDLYDLTRSLDLKQSQEYGEQHQATFDLRESFNEAGKVYITSLKVARIALKGSKEASTALMLHGSRKIDVSGWLEQAITFYSNLISNEAYMVEMLKFNRTPELLQAEYDMVMNVQNLNNLQQKEMGEAQQSTKDRDKKLDELLEWVSDLKKIAKLALEEKPQLLEKLGILVRS
jgi:hypothetical protein